MSMTQGEKIATIETQIKEMKIDINKQDALLSEIHQQGKTLVVMAEQIKHLNECASRQDKRLDAIEQKPSKRWDIVFAAFVAAIVSYAMSFLN